MAFYLKFILFISWLDALWLTYRVFYRFVISNVLTHFGNLKVTFWHFVTWGAFILVLVWYTMWILNENDTTQLPLVYHLLVHFAAAC